jgi:TonB dependent receptor
MARLTLITELALAGLFWLATATPAAAQLQRGQLRLEVRDPAGAGAAARGEILSQGNEFQRSFQVANDGNYLLQDLPFGVYRLSIRAEGFATWSSVVEVHSIVPVKVEISLGVATVTTQVQVNDEKTLVDPTATGSLFSIGRQSIQESLSSQPGRDLQDLTASQPGWLFEANGVLHPRGSEYDVQFVVDGQPFTQNRSPAFAPDMDSDEVESMRVLTANFPAEYGRKLGGVVEVTTDKSVPAGWHGELDAAGGSFDHFSGTAGFSFSTSKSRLSANASGLHSDRYLDPPVFENYTNQGNSGGLLAQYEHEFGANDRLRISFLHDRLGYIVPNDLVQQNQLIGPQRQDAAGTENGGLVYFQHSISPTLFLTVSGGVRDSSFSLRSNLLSTPVIVEQNRGYTEGYVRGDIAGHHGHHDWKAGVDSFFTPVHEALAYHITNSSQFDPGTQINFQFHEQKWDVEPSSYVQDQMHYGNWNFSVGIRFDYYSFAVSKAALSPRLGVSYFVPSWNLLLHAAYDRIFQTPAMENLLLASSPELDSVSPEVLRVPVPPARANFYEAGVTKALFSKFRLDANVFRRDFHNYADDDVLLQTGVSFPISYSKARITGEEVRLEVPHWGRYSGFVSYANQSGLGQGPITGGLFIGSDSEGALTDTGKFAVSQDQRNTLRARVRFQASTRVWFAVSTQYGSGLPAELEANADVDSLIAQFGGQVVSRVNLDRGRVDPNFSLDLATGAELYRKELRALQFQLQATNVTNRMNVINFASLFSGTAVGPPRMISARLRFTF